MFFAVHRGLTFHVTVAEAQSYRLILARIELHFTRADKGGAFTNILFLQCPVLLTHIASIFPEQSKFSFYDRRASNSVNVLETFIFHDT